MKLRTGFLLATGLSVLPTVAGAEATDSPIVVTASGAAQPRDTSGQAITLIDARTIDRLQSPTVADLLLTTPSVRVNNTGGLGSVTGLSLRGAEIGQTVVLLDGVRVNDPSSPSDATDFGNLVTANVRGIEVMRGANAVPYGSEAIGGVIALSTIDAAAPDGLSATALAEAGSWATLRGRAGIDWKGGNVRAGLGAAYLHSDGISSAAPRFGATETDGVDNLTVNGRLDVEIASDAAVELRGGYVDARLAYDSFFAAPADSPDTSAFRQGSGSVAMRFPALDGRIASRVSVSLLDNARDYRFTPAGPVSFGYRGETWRADYQAVIEAGGAVRIIAGYAHVAPRYRFFGFGMDETHEASSNGVHALLLLNASDRFSVAAGARHDWQKAFGGVTTFGANANLALGEGGTRLRAAFGQGFRAPSLYQLYDTFSGTPSLAAERSDSFDLGVDQDIGGNGRLSLTLFDRITRNQIDYDFASFRYANLVRTRSRGLEIEARLKPAPGWELLASYSLLDARDRSAGSPRFNARLPRRAVHGLALAVDRSFTSGLVMGATVRASSGAVDLAAPSGNIGGYALLDLRASYPLARHIVLQGRVENATDRSYETAYGYGRPGRAVHLGARLAW